MAIASPVLRSNQQINNQKIARRFDKKFWQKAFLAFAFGAPTAYTGKNMRDAHAHMDLTEAHFNAVAKHLVETLQELNVSGELIDEVVAIAVSTKDDVLGN